MYIKSIDIQNFRRFEHFKCEFDPRLTLLMGANGTGKTSLLRAIFVGLSGGLQDYFGPFAGIADEDVRKVHSIDPALESWRTPIFPSRALVELDTSPEAGLLRFGLERTPNQTNSCTPDGPFPSPGVRQLINQWFAPERTKAIPLIARFGASHSWSGSGTAGQIQKPFERKQQIWERARGEVIDINGLAQWFQYNELRSLQERQVPLIYRVAREAVLSAIQAQDINYVVRDNQLMVQHESQGWRPFEQLSDGQRRLAAIFMELAMRAASLNSHLGEDCIRETTGVVTIDELDLHLHPRWQRDIIGNLLRVFPKLQFIVASHSPFLLQSAFEFGKVLDVGTGQFVEVGDASIEDIVETVMGVDHPQRSSRFNEMKAKAQAFYELLDRPATTPEEIAKLKAELDVAQAPFANDPASAAWLEQRRAAAGH